MGSYRYTFNKTIDYKEKQYLDTGKSSGYMRMRKEWKAQLLLEAPWIAEIPAHTVYGAMMDADKAYRLAVKKRAKGQKCNLPRSRKHTQRSFFLLGNSVTEKGFYTRYLGAMRTAEALPHKPADSRVVYEGGRWYLRYSYDCQTQQPESQGRVCSLDPGVRTFLTLFSPELLAKIQDGGFSRIVLLANHLDRLISKTTKVKGGRKKARYQLAISRARVRIKNLVDDLHYQTIGWLFRNFDTVVFPESDFTSACKKAKRKIRSKSVRSLLTWSFARFRDRLKHKAILLGKQVIIVSEAFTSRTANWCGQQVNNLGGRKTITAQGVTMDRDVNGALGILLVSLLAQPLAGADVPAGATYQLVTEGNVK
jgi:putative transposase